MRCEHCGRNEATFHYQSSVNGYTEEAHLCRECATALGYREPFGVGMAGAFSGTLDSVFSVLPSLFGGFDGFFDTPRLTPAARRTLQLTDVTDAPGAPCYEVESLLGEAEGQALRRERERNSLRFLLKEAVDAEDYEQAARLRDELKRLEERS